MGDCFGGTWFRRRFVPGELKVGPWRRTDDTAMAVVLLGMLEGRGEVDQDALAVGFAEAYARDPYRQYGAGMHDVLPALGDGEAWAEVTARQFGGQGSWGNGAAMRVAPLGAWFAGDLNRCAYEAARSAQVTHAHPEAAAGAVAVALAAALNVESALSLHAIAERVTEGDIGRRLRVVAELGADVRPIEVVGEVGSGRRMSAADTVPFALWCAARHPDDLEAALWATASGRGDVDTTCAITGGVVGARTGVAGLPAFWLAAAEPAR
ncbi:hydrolase [Actinoplanes sp. TBRC 11911]|nr:hydrolase [Actinoplanes sp. TBRC 11911]